MRLLWAVDHGLRSCSKRMQVQVGLTGPQRLALRMIGSYSGLSLSELAELLHVDRGTLTGILERLVNKGLVARRLDPRDARRSQLRLTASGRRLNSATAGTIEAKVQRALSALPADKVHAARDVLESLSRELIVGKATRGSAGETRARGAATRAGGQREGRRR